MGPLDDIEGAGKPVNKDVNRDVMVSDGLDGRVDQGLVEVEDQRLASEVGGRGRGRKEGGIVVGLGVEV